MRYNLFRHGDTHTDDDDNENGNEAVQLDSHEADFQKFKTQVHRELLDSLDLSRLADLDDTQLKAHIRRLAERIVRSRSTAVASMDEERLFDELIAVSVIPGDASE